MLLPSTRWGKPCAAAMPRVLGSGGFPWEGCWCICHVWDAEGRVTSTAAGAMCACVDALQTCGCASWVVALWIFLFSEKLGGAVACGYWFGKWSHRNIYEDCWVLRPALIPSSWIYNSPKCSVLSMDIPAFLLKGQREFALSWELKYKCLF